MGWYDWFSRFYDGSVEKIYVPFREVAAEKLALADGMRVLDAGCGTGLSLDVLSPGVGEQGQVVGVDLSRGMLKQARKRIDARGYENVDLVQASLLELERETLAEHLGDAPGFDRALCFLILTALKDWPEAFNRVWSWVVPGGRMVIVDTHTEKLGFQGRMVNLTARADIRREVWKSLESVSEGFGFERLDAPYSVGGDIIVAWGDKPE